MSGAARRAMLTAVSGWDPRDVAEWLRRNALELVAIFIALTGSAGAITRVPQVALGPSNSGTTR
jgi:hypothetical protein